MLPHAEDEALYIVNTDVQSGQGEHWCVVARIGGGGIEFWDPYGSPPEVYGLHHLWENQAGYHTYNPVCVQNIQSNVCGNHCLFYSFLRCRGFSMSEILKKYDAGNLRENDKMVERFVRQFGVGYKIRKM